jgi:hypothetical protein
MDEIIKICKIHGPLRIEDTKLTIRNTYTSYECKICINLYKKKYRTDNYEKCRESSKIWRLKNKEIVKENNKSWRQRNPERWKEIQRLSYEKNYEKYIKRNKILREKNPEKYREYQKIWSQKNRERSNKMKGDSYKRYIEKNREKARKYSKQYSSNMHDMYIRKLIYKNSILTSKDIPQEFIEVKRQHLLLLRKLKELKHGTINS